jgi:hypothetical protein
MWYTLKSSVAMVLGIMMWTGSAFSQSTGCQDYPLSEGISVEDVAGGTKIIATASVSVPFDDQDAVNDARDEATISAKAMITKFFQEIVTSDEAVNRAVNETRTMQGDAKAVSRTETIERVKRLRNQSSALLRGVVPLGDCYTPKREMRVSVGLKPETIASAERAVGAIGRSVAGQPSVAPSVPPGPASPAPQGAASSVNQPLNNVPGFSNAGRLGRF